jgi:hypothetical protein
MFLLIAILVAPQYPTSSSLLQPPGIRVIVRDVETDAPIPGIEVRLRGPSAPLATRNANTPRPNASPPPERKLVTDTQGVALFKDLPPGGYSFDAQADGYRGTMPSSVPTVLTSPSANGYLKLDANSGIQGYVLHMRRSANIQGHVTDAEGRPVPNAKVVALVAGYRDGRQTFFETQNAVTDRNGAFRLSSLAPGDYYIRVTSEALAGMPVYYPGYVDIESARTVSIRLSESIDGIDVHIPDEPGFEISGSVIRVPRGSAQTARSKEPATQFSIVAAGAATGDAGTVLSRGNVIVNADGKFTLAGIPAGAWDLFAVFSTPACAASGRVRINVADRNIDNVVIMENSADVSGRVVISGAGRSAQRNPQLRLSLLPQDNVPSLLTAQMRNIETSSDAEDFTFHCVPLGKYNLSFVIPPGFYISGIQMGARNIYEDAVIDVQGAPAEPIEITLTPGGGTIAGILQEDLRQQSTERYFEPRIALVPLSLPQRGNVLLHKTTTLIGPPGSFSFRDVPPGEYKVFAWENAPELDAEKNAEFVSAYEPFGASVTVVDGQTSSVRVQLIPFGR